MRAGLGFAAMSFVLNAVVGVVSAIVTARAYGVRTIGSFALVTAPWLLLTQLSNMAEQKALTRELALVPARDPRVTGLFLPVLAFSTALTAIVAVPVTLLGVGALTGPVGQDALVWPSVALVAGYVVIDNTSWNLDAVLSAFLAGRELLAARLAQAAAFPALAVALHLVSGSVWSLVIATLLSFVVGLALRLVLIGRFMGLRPARAELRRGFRDLPAMLGFALRLLPSRIATAITSQAGVWILGSAAPIREVGAFARANSLAVRLNDAGYRVSEILFPALVARHRAGDGEGFGRILQDALRASAVALLSLSAALGGVAAGLLDVFGPGFDDAADSFAALLFAGSLFVLVIIQSQALLATGRAGRASIVAIIRAVVSIGLMVPLAASLGGTGIALALLIGFAISWQGQSMILRRTVGPADARRDTRFAIGVVVSSVLGFTAGRATYHLLGEPAGTFVGLAAAGVGFAVGAVLTRFVTVADVRRARALLAERRGAQAVAAKS